MDNNVTQEKLKGDFTHLVEEHNCILFKWLTVPQNTVIVKHGLFGNAKMAKKTIFKIKKNWKMIMPLTKYSAISDNGVDYDVAISEMECADRISPDVDIKITTEIVDPVRYLGYKSNNSSSRVQKDADSFVVSESRKAVKSFIKALTYAELEDIYKQTTKRSLSDRRITYTTSDGRRESIDFLDVIRYVEEKTGVRIVNISLEEVKSPKSLKEIMEQRVVNEEKIKQDQATAESNRKIALDNAQNELDIAKLQARRTRILDIARYKLDTGMVIYITNRLGKIGYTRPEIIKIVQGFNRNPQAFTSTLISDGNNDILNAFMGAGAITMNNNQRQPNQQQQIQQDQQTNQVQQPVQQNFQSNVGQMRRR